MNVHPGFRIKSIEWELLTRSAICQRNHFDSESRSERRPQPVDMEAILGQQGATRLYEVYTKPRRSILDPMNDVSIQQILLQASYEHRIPLVCASCQEMLRRGQKQLLLVIGVIQTLTCST